MKAKNSCTGEQKSSFLGENKRRRDTLPRLLSRSLGTKLFGNVGLVTVDLANHHHGDFNLLCPERLGNEIADGNAGPRGKNFL